MLFMRFENHMQAKNCLNMCSDGILHFIELVFSLKNGCGQHKALYLIYMKGPGKIVNKFKSANFQSDIWSLDLLNTVPEYRH